MSQAGTVNRSSSPSGNVLTLSDNAGTLVTPGITGDIAVIGPNSAYTHAGTHILNIYGSSSYLVDKANLAPYSTISAAITAAVTGGASATALALIVVKPGVYTENLTVPAGIKIVSWDIVCSEANSSPSSSTDITAVKLVGTVTFTGTNSGLENIGIYPVSTNNAIVCATNSLSFYLKSVKTYPINASSFSITGNNLQIFAENCCFSNGDTSTTDKFYSGSGGGNLFFQDTYINNNTASTGCTFNHYFTNCVVETFFNLASTTALSTFFLNQAQIILPVSADTVITGSSTSALQVTGYNSVISTLGSNSIVASNVSSFINLYNCRVKGALPFGTVSHFDLIGVSYNDAAGDNTVLNYSTSSSTILSAVSTTVADSIINSSSNTGNSYVTNTFGTTATYAYGSNASGIYKFNYTNSASGTLATGTNLITYDPSAAVYVFEKNMQAAGGFGLGYTNPGAYPYTVLVTDTWISVDTSVARSVVLPVFTFVGQIFYIKDRTGNAGTNAITVTATGPLFIDGVLSYSMNTNYISRGFLFNGTAYEVL